MKLITTLAAAALVAGSATLALAQSSGGASASASGAGADPATPRQNMTRPTPNSPVANRRGDDMAPLQQSQVSNPTIVTKKKKRSMEDRTYR